MQRSLLDEMVEEDLLGLRIKNGSFLALAAEAESICSRARLSSSR